MSERLASYLDALASERPAPGGGSAAALVGALAAALVAMVARLTALNPKFDAKAADANALTAEADRLRADLEKARAADEAAFEAVVAAQKLPKTTDEEKTERTAHVQRALTAACKAPLAAAHLALQTLELSERACALSNTHLMSDLGCAAEFAAASLHGSAYNVRANHSWLHDREMIAATEASLRALEAALPGPLERVRRATAAA
ncbi:MAG: cyclodeaminase/cyclohydrolase family protein [Candidatus Eremiobacteraeota bacterium]|nr:cyclodeaminase/cyclohydrolase family protein [Candidatus Eremiobacteraeota bacterium]